MTTARSSIAGVAAAAAIAAAALSACTSSSSGPGPVVSSPTSTSASASATPTFAGKNPLQFQNISKQLDHRLEIVQRLANHQGVQNVAYYSKTKVLEVTMADGATQPNVDVINALVREAVAKAKGGARPKPSKPSKPSKPTASATKSH